MNYETVGSNFEPCSLNILSNRADSMRDVQTVWISSSMRSRSGSCLARSISTVWMIGLNVRLMNNRTSDVHGAGIEPA